MAKQNNPLMLNTDNTGRFGQANALGVLTESIWQDVGCQVSRDRVKQLVIEESGQFFGLDATQFASGLVHRRVRIRLIEETE